MSYKLEGIHLMLPTPFGNDQSVSAQSLEPLIELAKTTTCVGVVCLRVMGESSWL